MCVVSKTFFFFIRAQRVTGTAYISLFTFGCFFFYLHGSPSSTTLITGWLLFIHLAALKDGP